MALNKIHDQSLQYPRASRKECNFHPRTLENACTCICSRLRRTDFPDASSESRSVLWHWRVTSLSQGRILTGRWVWGLPGAGPCSQALVVAVRNEVTVAGQNLESKGGSGDCLGPDHFRKQLLWQCVMTSLSQLKILEFRALSGQFLCLLASLSQSKNVRAKCPKNVFFLGFWGPGGTPT